MAKKINDNLIEFVGNEIAKRGLGNKAGAALYEHLDLTILEFFTTVNLMKNKLGPSNKSSTSQKAAKLNLGKSGTQRFRVFKAIATSNDGLTRNEISKNLDLLQKSADGRVWQLIQDGLIVDTDRERPTGNGGVASVLILTPKGRVEWDRLQP